MKNANLIKSLEDRFDALNALDRKNYLKENLGDESIKNEIENDLNDYLKKISNIIKYGSSLSEDILHKAINSLSELTNLFNTITKQQSNDFIAQKSNHLSGMRANFKLINNEWPSVIAIMLEQKGFLSDEGLKEEFEKLKKEQIQNAENTIKNIKKESEKILNEAREIAKQIEERARKTATKISVEEAQNQFKEAQADHLKSVKLWAWLSSISLVLFVAIAIVFYLDLPKLEEGLMIYKTTLRITILVSIGAIATFCLKILRSSYHMFKHNQHRQRIANSIGSFVESAVTPEQRDLILTHLVESIANFGNSGLVKGEDDSINATKFVVDNLVRNISQKN